jgi:hypothetical protein
MPKTDFQCFIVPSRYLAILYGSLWTLGLLLAALGPFLHWAKLLFLPAWVLCAWHYWRKYQMTQHFCQLRYTQGHLLMMCQGRELELVRLVGQPRILPWLVELTICRENGQTLVWPIAADSMDADSFRRLKVLVKTQLTPL